MRTEAAAMSRIDCDYIMHRLYKMVVGLFVMNASL